VLFLSDRNGEGRDIWAMRADGVGEPRLLLDTERSVVNALWSPDQAWLIFRATTPPSWDILAQRPGVDSVALPLAAAPGYNEAGPDVSPDGRWLAYTSAETGTYQVYVRPFPDVNAGRWQVSNTQAAAPRWSRSGRELFFGTQEGIFAAQVDTQRGFRVSRVDKLFDWPDGVLVDAGRGWYDITPDDQRFLMASASVEGTGEPIAPRLVLVQNFFQELEERLPR
jgi:Tol biopolymer transport system component